MWRLQCQCLLATCLTVCNPGTLSLNPTAPAAAAVCCRYFETEEWNGIPGQWWFGGGTDITPNWVVEEDMKHFHGTYKQVRVLPSML